jgi:ubiquinone/menaquinone biosynthesis C-methylase UbiE
MHIPQSAWALEHHRFGLAGEGQADVVEKFLDQYRGVVADVGCGPQGQHASNLARMCQWLVAVDKDPAMVRAASLDPKSPNIAFVAANAYDLPFPVAAFDSVVALGLLAYITDITRLLAEFGRIVRKGGIIMLTDSVSRSDGPVLSAGEAAALRLVEQSEAHCPAASGSIKRRRLFVFETS